MDLKNVDFIVIDDNKLDCFIAEKIIRNTGRSNTIKSFTSAADALEYIKANEPGKDNVTIILCDIQMPVMNGFEFVEAFERLPQEIVERYNIYVLSSSINETDLNRVRYHASVKQFLNKPLNAAALAAILEPIQ